MTSPDELLARHGAALARVAAAYARPGAEREDLAQDILLAVVRALPAFRAESALSTYAFRIAHRCGLRHALRHRRLRAVEGELVEVEGPEPSPERVVIADDERRRLEETLRRLPIVSRQVVALRLEGLSHAAIGEVVGLTPAAVATRLHRARAALRVARERERQDPGS